MCWSSGRPGAGPARRAMPHITELAKKFAGKVTFIGMDIWEKAESPAALDQKLDKFVKDMGDKMGYHRGPGYPGRIHGRGLDEGRRPPRHPLVLHCGQGWSHLVGGPPGAIEAALDSILAGTFELKDSAAEAKEEQEFFDAQREAARAFLAFEAPMGRALRAKDWNLVLKVADEAQAKLPGSAAMREDLFVLIESGPGPSGPRQGATPAESVQIAGKARNMRGCGDGAGGYPTPQQELECVGIDLSG